MELARSLSHRCMSSLTNIFGFGAQSKSDSTDAQSFRRIVQESNQMILNRLVELERQLGQTSECSDSVEAPEHTSTSTHVSVDSVVSTTTETGHAGHEPKAKVYVDAGTQVDAVLEDQFKAQSSDWQLVHPIPPLGEHMDWMFHPFSRSSTNEIMEDLLDHSLAQPSHPPENISVAPEKLMHFFEGPLSELSDSEGNSSIPLPASRHGSTQLNNKKRKSHRKNSSHITKPAAKRRKMSLPSLTVRIPPLQDLQQFPSWPPKPKKLHSFLKQFIQCDNCDFWYHYGCVGIVPDDPQLESDAVFHCIPCRSSVKESRKVGIAGDNPKCARPDCVFAGASVGKDDFFVERIVGRARGLTGDFLWLVKWDGYDISHAQWILQSSMADHSRLIKQFDLDASKEGFDINTNSESIILLEEAVIGGWAFRIYE